MADDAEQAVEAYLKQVRSRLRGLNEEDTREIIEELRSHIRERAGLRGEMTTTTVEAALAALGDPEELAGQYVTNELLARAEVSRSPFHILDSLFRWASMSIGGFFVLVGSMLGYFVGGAFMWCAVLKLIHPYTAGLWTYRDAAGDFAVSLRMGFEGPPAGGKDLLGWWIVPIGLLAGCGLVILTTRVTLWCAGLYRKSWRLPTRG